MWLAVLGLVFGGLGVAIGWYSLRPLIVLPRLLRSEVDDLSAVATTEEFVVCRGTATASERTLAAPFTDRNCLGFEYEITERQPFGGGLPWHQAHLDYGVATVPFSLDGENRTVDIDPSTRRFSLDTDSTVITVGATETPPAKIQRFVEVRDGLKPVSGWLAAVPGLGSRRYVERRIDPGQEYVIAGHAEHRQGEISLTGDLVITDQPPRGLAVTRLWTAAIPLLIAGVFIGIGLWGLFA
jgi:hypothetical protein